MHYCLDSLRVGDPHGIGSRVCGEARGDLSARGRGGVRVVVVEPRESARVER